MRAFTLDSSDTPPGLREDLPAPQVGPDQLLVRVQASSVNPVDAFIAAGYLKGMAEHEFPVVLGRDYAGVVEQAASAVTDYAPGDEVYGWLLHANPTVHEGSWAELIAVPQGGSVARRPATVEVAQAGAAPLAALTALAASDALELGEGTTVLVVGPAAGWAASPSSWPPAPAPPCSPPASPRTRIIWVAWGPPRSWTATPTSSPPSAGATPTGSTPCSTWSPPTPRR
jgi:NADPH:quinone reductase